MNHKEKLLEIYSHCTKRNHKVNLNKDVLKHLSVICDYIESQKGVYTVLITLSIHKILFPKQDIRYHQDNMDGGFSGRSIDTKYITPTLKELGLASMSESGWLTRSLEQPYPYTTDYGGKISNKKVRDSFLEIADFINSNETKIYDIVYFILTKSIEIRENNKVEISPLTNSESLTIEKIMMILSKYMYKTYNKRGGSKIPVLIIYSIYEILIEELKRYSNCSLKELGFHTTSDRTSKSSGDIEVFKENKLLESVEIKFEIDISEYMVNRAIEKIYKYNPKRYYILSTSGINQDEYEIILKKINDLKNKHGCHLIVNGLLPTLKYYMRLLSDLSVIIKKITDNILLDKELKIEHKIEWKNLIETNFSNAAI